MCRHRNKKLRVLESDLILSYLFEFRTLSFYEIKDMLIYHRIFHQHLIPRVRWLFINRSGVFNYFWCVIKVTWRIIKSRVVSFSSIENMSTMMQYYQKRRKFYYIDGVKYFMIFNKFFKFTWSSVTLNFASPFIIQVATNG